jgi:hypothetical protein
MILHSLASSAPAWLPARLARPGLDYLKSWDERGAWSEDQPSAEKENEFVRRHGSGEYAKWHTGINNEKGEGTNDRCEFPYGDFRDAHGCGVISAESRAGQYKHLDIEKAAAHIHKMTAVIRPCSMKLHHAVW